MRRIIRQCYPRLGFFKFGIDGAARGKLGLVGIRSVLWNIKGEILFPFSKHKGLKNLMTKVMAILEALRIFSPSFRGKPIVQSDSSSTLFLGFLPQMQDLGVLTLQKGDQHVAR